MLADPGAFVRVQREVVGALRARARRRAEAQLHRHQDGVTHLGAQLRTLSPQSTLDRGYAIVQRVTGDIVTDPQGLAVDELLRVTVARGDFGVRTAG